MSLDVHSSLIFSTPVKTSANPMARPDKMLLRIIPSLQTTHLASSGDSQLLHTCAALDIDDPVLTNTMCR